MASSKLSPRDILHRLQTVHLQIEDGAPIAEALQAAAVRPAEYEAWQRQYAGLLRTLGPLAIAPSNKRTRRVRRSSPAAG